MPTRADSQAETRRQILQAAVAEFASRGVAAVSLDHIAAQAGFTKGAIYSNFDSKTDLLFAVLEQRKVDVGSEYVIATEIESDEDLAESIGMRAGRSQAEGVVQQRVLVALWAEAMRDEAVAERLASIRAAHRERVADSIRARAESAGIELPVSAEHLALGLTGMSMSIMFDSVIASDVDAGAAHAAMIDVVLNGVLAMAANSEPEQ